MTPGGLVVLFVLCSPAVAWAQAQPPSLRPRQLTVSAGGVFASGYPIGDLTANLRRNTTGTPPPFPLVRAESEIERVLGFEARIGFAVSRSAEIEVGGSYATPQLGVTLSQDDELRERAFAGERLQQYVVDVSGVYLIPRMTLGSRARPYVIGGAGYLRQLHEGRLQLETGGTIHVGGGLRYWVYGARPDRQAIGGRAEVRYVRRTGGIDFEDQARAFATISVLGFVGF